MSEHQPMPVAGYTPQSDAKVDLVNRNKVAEERVLRILDELKDRDATFHDIDQRWLAIGRTHLEQAFMAINRAVFQPKRVSIPEEPPT
jgi:hypothetical protein